MNGKLGWALAMVILTAAACSKQAARVSVSARAETPADGGTTAGCAGLSLNGGDVCVTDVQIEIRKVKLEGPANENANADAGAANDGSGHMLVADQKGSTDSGEDVDEDNEVRVGPCPLHLSGSDLQAGILSPTICAGDVPDGTYNELRIVIAPIDAAADASAVPSVTIAGTFKGTAFAFVSSLKVVQKNETTITIDAANSKSLTISFDPASWFTAADGATSLDPGAAANQAQIEANIKASIKSFEDDDRDGHDDHGGDGSGHH